MPAQDRNTGPTRRRMLAAGIAAALGPPVPGYAGRGLPPVTPPRDAALRRVQDPPELGMALPALDRERAELIRMLLGGPAFQATLTRPAAPPTATLETGFAPDAAKVREARDAFLLLADRRLSAEQREQLVPESDIAQFFEDITLKEGPPAIVMRGTDVVDQFAFWLLVTFNHAQVSRLPVDAEGDAFMALRAQVLHGYAAQPRLTGLDPAGRHDLAAWLLLNSAFTMLKATFTAERNGNDGASAADAAIRSDLLVALRGFGLDPAGLTLDEHGLRRA